MKQILLFSIFIFCFGLSGCEDAMFNFSASSETKSSTALDIKLNAKNSEVASEEKARKSQEEAAKKALEEIKKENEQMEKERKAFNEDREKTLKNFRGKDYHYFMIGLHKFIDGIGEKGKKEFVILTNNTAYITEENYAKDIKNAFIEGELKNIYVYMTSGKTEVIFVTNFDLDYRFTSGTEISDGFQKVLEEDQNRLEIFLKPLKKSDVKLNIAFGNIVKQTAQWETMPIPSVEGQKNVSEIRATFAGETVTVTSQNEVTEPIRQ